ncbi:unnamed protein product [Nippostrongylus brasiliensis]|uniref:LD16921p (inferred by orthology to a D. melanogaster protein) n=1 Tax=Nippostrongylus brasiliensis TaxID=27835 RepID=A0A0N4YXT4_NIPBR|nr:unnamed protein product [Nippostrongylus brasiliensis]
MSIPARSVRCVHAGCFDLEPFIMQQNENSLYECHICRTIFQLNEIEIDYFVGKVLRETTGNQATEMLLEANGDYRPIESELNSRKRPNDENANQCVASSSVATAKCRLMSDRCSAFFP